MYKDRKRQQAFVGAIISAAGALAGGIAGAIKKRKAQKELAEQQKNAAIRQSALNTAQNSADAANQVLDINNDYRQQFANSIMKCGGKRKAKCGGKKKANLGIEIATGALSAAGSIASGLSGSSGFSNTANMMGNAVKQAGEFAKENAIKRNQQKEQQLHKDAIIAMNQNRGVAQYATVPTQPTNLPTIPTSNSVIGDAALGRYGGRRKCKYGRKC